MTQIRRIATARDEMILEERKEVGCRRREPPMLPDMTANRQEAAAESKGRPGDPGGLFYLQEVPFECTKISIGSESPGQLRR